MATSATHSETRKARTDRRVRRGYTDSGARTARIYLNPNESVGLYANDDGTFRVHCGPMMVSRLSRDDIELQVEYGVATVKVGGASIGDATASADDGAWELALAWVLDGDRS